MVQSVFDRPKLAGMAESLHRERMLGGLLGFVSGFVDTAGFIMLLRLFTAHITGNLVVAAAGLTTYPQNILSSRLGVVLIFVAAVALSTALATWLRQIGRSPIRWLLWCEAVALACFALIGTLYGGDLTMQNELQLIGVASFAVAAMGIHITLNKETPYAMGMTNVMTNNLTTFTICATRLFMRVCGWPGGQDNAAALRGHLAQNGVILAGFLLGVILSGFLVPRFEYGVLCLPLAVIVLLAVTCRDEA